MAGTTVADDGTVIEAFAAAVDAADLPGQPRFDQAMTAVRSSMGQSKIEVFRRILGDEAAAQGQRGVRGPLRRGGRGAVQIAAVPGAAEETIGALRDAGIRVCLATGFSPATRDAIIDALGWGG